MQYTTSNPLRVITLCSGYDAQCLALERLKQHFPGFDYELVAWAEIDRFAIQAHNALFPQWADRNIGDITTCDWTKVPQCDLLTYSTPCFLADTLVYTQRGYKEIETISSDDMVLTHRSEWHRVVKPMRHTHFGQIYHIFATMFDKIECTPNHPFYVRKRFRCGHKRERFFAQPEWAEAKNLTPDHYLGYAINQKSELPTWHGIEKNNWGHHKLVDGLSQHFANGTFWYLMGRYVGDGWQRKSAHGRGIVICCSDRNRDSLLKAFDSIGWNYSTVEERTVAKQFVYSKELFYFVQRYGDGAINKQIDAETLNLPHPLLQRFLDGIMDSDGWSDDTYEQVTTVSRKLAYSLTQCVAKVKHRPASMCKYIRPEKTIIEGRLVNQHDTYLVRWKKDTRKQDKAFYENGYIWFPIHAIESDFQQVDVYNMEVDTVHSYTANGAIVHNCQSVSNAGKREGITEGSGTASSILWSVRDAIRVLRPKFLLQENVKGLVSKKFIPEFHKWQRTLEEFGYTNFTSILNAKDFGVPQNRERVFAVSILGKDAQYNFPKGWPCTTTVADILEEDVPEHFFLSDERVANLKLNLSANKVCNVNPSGNGINGAVYSSEGLSPTITTNKGEGQKILVSHDKR